MSEPSAIPAPEGRHAAPVGVRQQLAYVLVQNAMWQANATLARQVGATVPDRVRDRDQVSAERMLDYYRNHPWPERRAERLYRALVWREVSAVAAEAVSGLVVHYRVQEGLDLDIDASTVRVAVGFAAVTRDRVYRHDHRERQRLHAIDAAWTLLNEAMTPAPPAVHEAVARVPVTRADRAALRSRLRGLGVSERDAETAVFVLAYLSANTADLDYLTETPVLVDPGEEAKPLVAQMLAEWQAQAAQGRVPAEGIDADWAEAITWLGPQDREAAERARIAIGDLDRVRQPVLWEFNADRGELAGLVADYRIHLQVVVDLATQVGDCATEEQRHEIDAHLAGLGTRRAVLEDRLGDPTLLDIENTRLRDVLGTLDTGDLAADPMLFVGEFSLRTTDLSLRYRRGDQIASYGASAITAALRDVDAAGFDARTAADSQARDPLNPRSIAQRLADIADGDVSPGGLAGLMSDVEWFLARTPASESAVVVLTGEVQAWVDAAADHGRGTGLAAGQWDQRMLEVCVARDTGTLRFPEYTLGTPAPHIDPVAAEIASYIHATFPPPGPTTATATGTPVLDPGSESGFGGHVENAAEP